MQSAIYTIKNQVVVPLSENEMLRAKLDELESRANDLLACVAELRRADFTLKVLIE